MTLYGDLNENGIEVFIENDMVVLVDNNERIEKTDTPENRKELIMTAEEIEKQWKKEKAFEAFDKLPK